MKDSPLELIAAGLIGVLLKKEMLPQNVDYYITNREERKTPAHQQPDVQRAPDEI